MAEIQIGDAAMAGFKLVGRRPLSVLAWGLVTALFIALILLLFGGGLAAAVVGLMRNRGAEPDPAQVFGLVGSIMGAVLLLIVGLTVIGAMIQGAVFRAELSPEKRGVAYLQFGSQELWLIAVNFVMGVVLWVAQLVMSIPLVIITVMLGVSGAGLGADNHNPGASMSFLAGAVGIRIIGQLVIAVVTGWLWVRLCLGTVISFRERQFRLFESWSMTKGHGLQMFLVMLLVVLMLAVLYIVAAVILFSGVAGTAMANADLRDPAVLAALAPGTIIGRFAAVIAIGGILMVIFTGVVNAMTWGAVARMYLQLNPPDDVAKTFA